MGWLRNVKKITGVGIFLAALVMASFSWADSSQALIGTWVTSPVLGQLGRAVTTYVFNDNGTFQVSMEFVDAKLPEWKVSGTYEVIGDKLITHSESGENSSYFRFDGDELIINDKGEEFRYWRVRK